MTTTTLARILNDMDFFRDAARVEERFKVRALDNAIRRFRRNTQAPWTLQHSTLRVFDDVLEYPTASDHDEIAFFDDESKEYYSKPDFRYTSIEEFYKDPNNRNDLAEIWDGGTKYLGVRHRDGEGKASTLLNNAETVGDWTASGTASNPTKDTVFYNEGNGSIQFDVTAGTATMKATLNSNLTDSNYKRKYKFIDIYIPGTAPTSVTLRLHIDGSNYLETTGITTQFSGQASKSGAWNTFAMDLNEATENGTIGSNPTFTYLEFDLVGAAAGTYYVDASYLREWTLLEYWYYSKFYCQTVSASSPDQEYFLDSNELYSTDTSLIGESEFVDVMRYDALAEVLIDVQNKYVKDRIDEARAEAWATFYDQYPSLMPQITTSRYNYAAEQGGYYEDYYVEYFK